MKCIIACGQRPPVVLFFLFFSALLFGQDQRPHWHFMDRATIPQPGPAMPAYLLPLYGEEVDLERVISAHEAHYATRGAHEWAEDLERNPYAKFFHQWLEGAGSEAGPDGIVRSLTTEALVTRRAKARQLDLVQQRRNLEKSASAWSFVGPKRTLWRAEHRAGQPVAPWQINLYSFDVAPSNPSILFAGSETGEVYKTTDKGGNWTPVKTYNFTGAPLSIAIHPTNPDVVVVGLNTGIVRTDDGGVSWSLVHPGSGLSCNSLEFSTDGSLLLAGTGTEVLRSTDGGLTWTATFSGEIMDLAFRPGDNQTAYALKRNPSPAQCEFYKSTDGGQSFTLSMTGWTPYPDHSGGRISVTPAAADYLYAVVLQDPVNRVPVLLKSTNAGDSWTEVAVGGVGGWAAGQNGQGYYDLDLEANDLDAESIIVGTNTSWKSGDGGVTFTDLGGYSGPFDIHPDIQEIVSFSGDTWIATDGGMNYSSDFFSDVNNFEARIDGLDGTNFWGYDQGWNEDYMIGGRYHNGNTALHENYPPGYALRMGGAESPTGHAWHGKPRHAMFDDISNTILPEFITDVAEGTFPFTKYPNIFYYGREFSRIMLDVEDYHTFYVGEGQAFWRSTDGGISWESLFSFGADVYHYDISRANPDVIYLLARNGVWRSDDRGATFAAVSIPPGLTSSNAWRGRLQVSATNSNDVWFLDAGAGASSSRHRVWYSNNGGSSWTSWHTAALTGRQWRAMAHHAGSNGGIYISSTRGNDPGTLGAKVMYRDFSMSDWMDCSNNFPASASPLTMLPFYRDNVIRWAGNRGIWEMPLVQQSWNPIAQPFVNGKTVLCAGDPVVLDSYSVAKSNATYNWTVPGATTSGPLSQRRISVTFAAPGTYTATLSVSQDGQTDTKSVTIVVGTACDPDPLPGNSVVFSGGSSDYVAMQSPLNLTSNTVTFSAWIKREGDQPSRAGIIFARGSSAIGLGFAGSNDLSVHWNDQQWWWESGLVVPDKEWAHVAMTVDPSGVTLYLNGVPARRNFSATPATFDGPLRFGSDPSSSTRRMIGEMDEVVVYNRTLSQAEIRELMHLTRIPSAETGMLAYYQFNEDSGLAPNKTGGIHAALSGGTFRTTSTAPVGPGLSHRLAVTNPGPHAFGATGLNLDFTAGTLPDGELCVTRIDLEPDQLPAAAAASGKYWVIHNYGANAVFTGLEEMGLSNVGPVSAGQAAAPESILLFKRGSTADGMTWGAAITTATAATAGAGGSVSFSAPGITSFSQFVLGFEAPALGAELRQFAARPEGKNVQVSWTTEREENLACFVVERGTDGLSFTPLARVTAAGTSGRALTYDFPDTAPLRGRSYYRLRLVDNDGTESFSAIRSVLFRGLAEEVVVFPNPLPRGGLLRVLTGQATPLTLELYTATGKRVGAYRITGDTAISLDDLPRGSYSYRIMGEKYRKGGILLLE